MPEFYCLFQLIPLGTLPIPRHKAHGLCTFSTLKNFQKLTTLTSQDSFCWIPDSEILGLCLLEAAFWILLSFTHFSAGLALWVHTEISVSRFFWHHGPGAWRVFFYNLCPTSCATHARDNMSNSVELLPLQPQRSPSAAIHKPAGICQTFPVLISSMGSFLLLSFRSSSATWGFLRHIVSSTSNACTRMINPVVRIRLIDMTSPSTRLLRLIQERLESVHHLGLYRFRRHRNVIFNSSLGSRWNEQLWWLVAQHKTDWASIAFLMLQRIVCMNLGQNKYAPVPLVCIDILKQLCDQFMVVFF